MFNIFGIGGRAKKCENCKNRNAEMCIDGDSDICKWYLCRTCFFNLIEGVEEYARKFFGRPGTKTTSPSEGDTPDVQG